MGSISHSILSPAKVSGPVHQLVLFTRIRTGKLPDVVGSPVWALFIFLLMLVSGVSSQTPQGGAPPGGTVKSLLIAIWDYPDKGPGVLYGPENDLKLVKDYLAGTFGGRYEETVLTNKDATHKRIVAALTDLAANANAGDTVFIYYSGHGSLVADFNGDEKEDGMDSTWVTYGSRSTAIQETNRLCPTPTTTTCWMMSSTTISERSLKRRKN